ncbi:uncharacterized protein B0H18DRAFT_208792 [Fomitopsis serialis]|uniref:uncharacterized protein n=1 Tax=Fomitopsis serialis TaxID=139415 RepID=UPI0020081D87|nr:uncharacterized protein B0H18DRAFT_208792 [Neoantrodia serialis]KAH9929375.1 hypothetical protein B0H18DRAFT_208792 [Neoantrodia serialis]
MSSLQKTIWIAALIQVMATAWLLAEFLRDPSPAAVVAKEYSYIGHDYPVEFPVSNIERVAMTLQESVHFSLNVSDHMANKEWDALDKPRHFGSTHVGPQFRSVATVFGHQLHCLRTLHSGVLTKYGHSDEEPNYHHWQHCLNYLRQTFLCDAIDTLEEGDFMQRDYAAHRMGDNLLCRDWEAVFAALDRKQQEWLEFNIEWVAPELTAPQNDPI